MVVFNCWGFDLGIIFYYEPHRRFEPVRTYHRSESQSFYNSETLHPIARNQGLISDG